MARRGWRERVMAECGGRPGAVEDYPFGDGAAVFKVAGKMFAVVALGDDPGSISLKCDPDFATELRHQYPAAITPGYHLNKRHWNTVLLDGTVPADELVELIDHSYDLVVSRLTKAARDALIMNAVTHDRPAPPAAW
jgi:predicted DNA-binding protein (MmcQ/YjbR family)